MESVDYENGTTTGTCKCKVQPGDIPAIAKPANTVEGKAYQDLQNTPLKEFIPTFYGYHKNGDQENIIISDLTAGFESVCLVDLRVGRRHFDINSDETKRKRHIEKQKGSTTESLGVRLIDAKIRQGDEIVKQWDKKQGLKFSYDDLEDVFNQFIPTELKKQFAEKCDKIYAAYDETLEKNPGFRMYCGSILVAYDGQKKDDLKILLISLACTHIDIGAEGKDPNDEEFEDGVLQGLATLINFSNSDCNVPPADKGQIDVKIVDDPNDTHKGIKKCIINPGNIQCIIRPENPNETAAITHLSATPIAKYVPKIYGIHNNKAIVEDINIHFSSPCIADFKIGSKSYDIDDPEDVKIRQREKDVMTTTANCRVRLTMAMKTKGKKPTKVWKRKEVAEINKDEGSLKQMIIEYADCEELKEKIATELVKLLEAYEATRKEHPFFRMFDISILIFYDGDDLKKAPRCVFAKLAESHIDIQAEGLPTGPESDDEVVTGISNLIKYLSPNVHEKAIDASASSKCCLLL